MQGRKITKEEFDRVKMLLAKGFNANEIFQNKFVDLSLPSIYRIQKMKSYDEETPLNEKAKKYDELIEILFNCANVDERNFNELFFPNVRVREALKTLENERYNDRLYELNQNPMWYNKETNEFEYK